MTGYAQNDWGGIRMMVIDPEVPCQCNHMSVVPVPLDYTSSRNKRPMLRYIRYGIYICKLCQHSYTYAFSWIKNEPFKFKLG